MESIEEIKDKIAKEYGYKHWRDLEIQEADNQLDIYILQVAQRFANQIAHKWISINDHLPEDANKTSIHDLVFTDGAKVYVGQLGPNKLWKDYKTDQFISGITHWMHLPHIPIK